MHGISRNGKNLEKSMISAVFYKGLQEIIRRFPSIKSIKNIIFKQEVSVLW